MEMKLAKNILENDSLFEMRECGIANPMKIEVPKSWSQTACNILADKYIRKAGVPSETEVSGTNFEDFFNPKKPTKDAVFGAETSIRQVIHRLAGAWSYWGFRLGYFDRIETENFYHEVCSLLLEQVFAPNSPQWFNTGLNWAYGIKGNSDSHYHMEHYSDQPDKIVKTKDSYERPQPSACFIQPVDDSIESIMDLWSKEARLFKYGSGTGTNFSDIRGKGEILSGGGKSSGLMSFLKIGDTSAGSIKSGGTTRRAAKMCVLDADHPEIMEFINWKRQEESKVAFMVEGSEKIVEFAEGCYDRLCKIMQEMSRIRYSHGYYRNCLENEYLQAEKFGIPRKIVDEMSEQVVNGMPFNMSRIDFGWQSEGYLTISGQNSNNSVRLTDDFMKKMDSNEDWDLILRTDGEVHSTLKAKQIWDSIAYNAWSCADPGIQFHDTINAWNTCIDDGEIRASNPCFVGETLIDTTAGYMPIEELAYLSSHGGELPKAFSWDESKQRVVLKNIEKAWESKKTKKLVEVITNTGTKIVCTPDHRFLTRKGKWVEAQNLKVDVKLRSTQRINKESDKTCVKSVRHIKLKKKVPVYDLTVEGHNFAVTDTGNSTLAEKLANPGKNRSTLVVHNCSEYLWLDNTACNLASINLKKFLTRDVDGMPNFDYERFACVSGIVTAILDISVSMGSYPTKEIAEGSYKYRTLGLGFANLGGLLMSMGIPYDSECARNWASTIASIMHGTAYKTSQELAKKLGRFPAWNENQDRMAEIIVKHSENAKAMTNQGKYVSIPESMIRHEKNLWKYLVNNKMNSFRNAQVTVIAPTGTIGLLMDCDTTGIEPDFSLVKHKSLAGGGSMEIVNQSIDDAIQSIVCREIKFKGRKIPKKELELRISDLQEVVSDEIIRTKGILSKDFLEGYFFDGGNMKVFDCANDISPQGHIDMMEAVQPFISGAISKTINMPADATVDDVKQVYYSAWKKGLKAVAVYRDGSKYSQPMVHASEELNKPAFEKIESGIIGDDVSLPDELDIGNGNIVEAKPIEIHGEAVAYDDEHPLRRRLPIERNSRTIAVNINGHKLYLHIGEYENGDPGEIFINMKKEGTTLGSMMNNFAVALSIGMQYGVPLQEYIDAFVGTKSEPYGMVHGHENIKTCTSIADFILKHMAIRYMGQHEYAHIKPNSIEKIDGEFAPNDTKIHNYESEPCSSCGSYSLTRNGTCMVCQACGETTGCS